MRLHLSLASTADGSHAFLFWKGIGWLSSGRTWNTFLAGNPKNHEALIALRNWESDTQLPEHDAMAYQARGNAVARLFRKAMPSIHVTFGPNLPINRGQTPVHGPASEGP